MKKLNWIFHLMLFIGAGAYVLNFLGLFESVYNNNRTFFLIMMWIGMVGWFLTNKKIKK